MHLSTVFTTPRPYGVHASLLARLFGELQITVQSPTLLLQDDFHESTTTQAKEALCWPSQLPIHASSIPAHPLPSFLVCELGHNQCPVSQCCEMKAEPREHTVWTQWLLAVLAWALGVMCRKCLPVASVYFGGVPFSIPSEWLYCLTPRRYVPVRNLLTSCIK